MHLLRSVAAAAGTVVLVAALGGCTGSTPESGPVAGSAAAIAVDSAVTTLNPNAAQSIPDATVAALTGTGFFLPNAAGVPVANTKFGTVTKLGDSPLRVRYTIRSGVTWSDGTAVTAADLLLQWAAAQPGNSPPTGAPTGGVDFGTAGVATSLAAASALPTISKDGRSLSVRFDRPITTWRTAFGSTVSAAGTFAIARLGAARGRAAQAAVVRAITTNNRTTLAALATAWRTGYSAAAMPTTAAALVGDGPYVVTGIVAGQYLTLEARARYTAGPIPRLARITVRVVPEGKAQVEALQNGQVDVMSGPATSTAISVLRTVSDTTAVTTDTASTEYLRLSPDNGGPFDAASYRSRSARAREVRQALLHVIPRAKLVASLFATPAPKVTVANSQIFQSAAPSGATLIAGNGSQAYGSVDAAAARALLKRSGARLPVTVRLAVPAGDAGARAFTLIRSAAEPAGFRIVAAGTGEPDATMAAAIPNVDDAARTTPLFSTGGAQNTHRYTNAAVDAAYQQLQTTTDVGTRSALLRRIDRLVWSDATSMPLFARTDVTGISDRLAGVRVSPIGPIATFFAWRESAAADGPED